MRSFAFDIRLIDPVVVSASGATAGGHHTVRHLPGSLFLGAAAAQLYATLPREDAYTVFHSGRVRFLPAFPASSDGSVAHPTPRSYHVEKYGDPADAAAPDRLPAGTRNLARDEQAMARPQPVESPFLTSDGGLVSPARQRALKTAIDPSDRRRQESQLFAYEALAAGNRFRAAVHLDDDVPEAIDALLVQALCDRRLRLGRSKRREFGRVVTGPASPASAWAPGARESGTLVLYLLSDLALLDPDSGQPTLEPTVGHFGLPADASVAWERTFIRARRYSPINSTRRRPDLERQVLAQGSVISFQTPTAPTDEQLAALANGVGAYRSEGLGQVLVEPPFLADRAPVARSETSARPSPSASRPPKAARPTDPLAAWAEQRASDRRRREDAYDAARTWFEALLPLARRRGGPGRAQWGFVREQALVARSGSRLLDALFDSPTAFLRRGVRKEPWSRVVDPFAELVRQCPEDSRCEATRLLASRMQRELQRRLAEERS